MLRSIQIISCGLFFAVGMISCGGKKEEVTKTDSLSSSNIAPKMIVSIGRIEPELKIIKLSAEVSGVVKKINYQAGDSVKKDAVIIELTNDLERAQVALNNSQFQTKYSDIASAEANMEEAKLKLENQKTKYERLKNSYDKGAETKQNMDNANTDYLTAQKEVERLSSVLMSYRKQQQEVVQQTSLNQIQLQRRFIKAP
ncbi:MAG TPA: biotin/lipoyl-binding protein, partial [Cytophagaceae bacterium]|nr:biotin/lipoyl-binding protein [Cytophagaceae bacterium]